MIINVKVALDGENPLEIMVKSNEIVFFWVLITLSIGSVYILSTQFLGFVVKEI